VIQFGRDTICPHCRKRDRRKMPYADGKIEMSLGLAIRLGRKIVRRYNARYATDTVLVECPVCDGKGYVSV
jgi:hypothetical protein